MLRSAVVVVLVALASAVLPAQAKVGRGPESPAARAVVNRYAALTRDTLLHAPFTHSLSETTTNDGRTIKTETFLTSSGKVFTRITMPGSGTTEVGYSGKIGWTNTPSVGLNKLEGEPLKMLLSSLQIGFEPVDKRLSTVWHLRKDTLGGRAVDVILGASTRGDTLEAYFEIATGLLSAVRVLAAMGQPGDSVLTHFSDYKRLGGALRPSTMTMRGNGIEVVTRTVSYDHDPIDAKVFEPPPALFQSTKKPQEE